MTKNDQNLPIDAELQDFHWAITSLNEEMAAVRDYTDRASAVADPALKKIFLHNAAEEKEHATMIVEWLRRNDPEMARELGERLGRAGEVGED